MRTAITIPDRPKATDEDKQYNEGVNLVLKQMLTLLESRNFMPGGFALLHPGTRHTIITFKVDAGSGLKTINHNLRDSQQRKIAPVGWSMVDCVGRPVFLSRPDESRYNENTITFYYETLFGGTVTVALWGGE